MSRILSKYTRPEMVVRRFLHANGFRFSLHDKKLPGKPDIVLPKYKTVIFVNGCFWHGHEGCKYFVIPKTRREWWVEKIGLTKKKDEINYAKFKYLGYKIIIIWECELKSSKTESTLNTLINKIKPSI